MSLKPIARNIWHHDTQMNVNKTCVASGSLSWTQEVIFVLSLVHVFLERVISGFDPY